MNLLPKSSWILPIAWLVALPVAGQVQLAWTVPYNGPDNMRESEPVVRADRACNVVVALTSARTDGGENFVIIKYDPAGHALWTNRFAGPAAMHSFVVDLALDAADNIYITGASPAAESSYDYVTIKFAPDGMQRWLARYSSSGASYDQPSAQEAQDVLAGAVGGESVTTTIEGRERYTVNVRYLPDFRADIGSVAAVMVPVGEGRVQVNVPATGYHCLMVYRETVTGTAAVHYTVRVYRTPPDFEPYYAGGWYAPFVPRNAADGTGASVPAPATLTGDVATTYFNFANVNDSPTGAPGLYQQAYEDGVYGWWLSWGAYGPGVVGLFNWGAAWTVRGGRHTLSTIEDPNAESHQLAEEIETQVREAVPHVMIVTHVEPIEDPLSLQDASLDRQ